MAMLQSPKKRIWPLLKPRICSNIRRQPEGEIRGSSPSITSSSARACQSVLVSKTDYFLAGAVALLPLFELRMALKKSDDGSTTITSLFLLKLAL
jgi:hypothetical protein